LFDKNEPIKSLLKDDIVPSTYSVLDIYFIKRSWIHNVRVTRIHQLIKRSCLVCHCIPQMIWRSDRYRQKSDSLVLLRVSQTWTPARNKILYSLVK